MIPSATSSPPTPSGYLPYPPPPGLYFPVTSTISTSPPQYPYMAYPSPTPYSTILHGIVPPLSSALPSENDLENNECLISYLVNNNVFETPHGQDQRDQILHTLLILARNWVSLIGRSRGYDENIYRNGGGVMLKIFGSQKLRVHSPEADMDILCVAPSYVSRYDFFTSFCQMLETLEGVSLLLPIPEAYTPVVKFNVGNQAIDMIFVSLPLLTIPPNINFQDNHLLIGLDEQGVRSLNGYRVAERLLELVPNVDTYCVALAAIKHWAKRRGIYANILGFLGGVNFAILVAHVCQMHINSCPATLVKEFFKLYNQWKWPNGILLTYIEELPPMDGVHFPSWNSKVYPGDKMHLMPIITPTAPAMNSAYNVGEPQKYMILREIQRGNNLFVSWKSQCDESGRFTTFKWEELFASNDFEFFQQYTHYIQIDVGADSPTEHRRWFGWCESRLRQLIIALHQPEVMSSHPYSNCYHRRISKSTGLEIVAPPLPAPSVGNSIPTPSDIEDNSDIKFRSSFFIGLSFYEYIPKIDLTPIIQGFLNRVCGWSGQTPSMDIEINVRTRSSLPRFIFESIALPSSTADCTPSKNKLRSDSTSVPPSIHHPSIPDETADSSNSLTPSIISLTDRLHVTFADNHTDLISSNGTPVASRSNSHLHHQNLELDNIPEDESSAHVAKTIFHDGDSDDETTNQNTSIHNSEMKIESNLNISSPSGRIKQYGSTSTHPNRGVVQPQIHDESLKSNLSPCKRSRSS